jgi:hypothetical protein
MKRKFIATRNRADSFFLSTFFAAKESGRQITSSIAPGEAAPW